jgi:hypothetical protein
LTQVCNADANAPIRIAVANEHSGKVVGVTDLNVNLLNDQKEFELKEQNGSGSAGKLTFS